MLEEYTCNTGRNMPTPITAVQIISDISLWSSIVFPTVTLTLQMFTHISTDFSIETGTVFASLVQVFDAKQSHTLYCN